MDDKEIFYMDMYSHADAGFRELQRERMASLFKSNLRVSKGNLKVDMGIQGINYTYKSSKGHAH